MLLVPGRRTAGLLGAQHRKAFTISVIYLSIVWALYPVCWGLADGSNTITVTGEMVFYGVLDILVSACQPVTRSGRSLKSSMAG